MASPLKAKTKKSSEKSLKLSRRQKWRRNPIPWAVLWIVTLAVAGIWVVPNALTWVDQKSKISSLSSENTSLETQIDTQKKVRNQEQEKFDQLAKGTLAVEDQRFPYQIDANKIAKIIEIYALQLNLSRTTFVDLQTLSFSTARPSDGTDYYETIVNMALYIDENSLKRFIDFVQTGLYDNQLTVDTISPENKGETAALEFLDDNLLPIAHIRSINLSEDSSANTEFPRKIYSAQMQLVFFSQNE